MKVHEKEFHLRIQSLKLLRGKFKTVTGPGRSGAIAAVYASYYLHIPFIPLDNILEKHKPILVIDTAQQTGKTLKKALSKAGKGATGITLFNEPPSLKFWYEYSEGNHQNTFNYMGVVSKGSILCRLICLPFIFLGKGFIFLAVLFGWNLNSAKLAWKEM